MFTLKRCDSSSRDFTALTELLDADLAHRNGKLQQVYSRYNKIQSIKTVVVAYLDNQPVGCGCFKPYGTDTVEIKRMFVKPDNREKGISKKILAEIETWALESGFTKTILETGSKQTEAIGLYNKSGYNRIDNFGQYAGIKNSICFGKTITK
jgi:GNAT superfamily N-acetyltransferase